MNIKGLYTNRIKKNGSQNKGFTLVELIIVITILAILCGLSAYGILSWQDWATFKKENEYAKTFFVAAQNQLAEYSANGRLEEVRDDLLQECGEDAEGNTVYIAKDGVNTASLTTEELGAIWAGANGKTDVIVSLSASAGDYDTYLSNPEGCSKEVFWVYEMLSNYVYDTGILNNGAVRIEFTPEDGQVYSVSYTDKYETFKSEESATKHYVDATNRTEEYRRERQIGYYNVDSLSKELQSKVAKGQIDISKVRLYNKETLYTTFKVKDLAFFNNTKINPVYTVIVVSEDKKDQLSIEISGVLKNEQAKVVENEVKAKVKRYGNVARELGEIPVLAWIEPNDTVHVVLDAADIAADTRTYNAGYNDITGASKNGTEKAEGDRFRKTYSFFRFGLDIQNIFIKIEASAKDYKKTEADNYSKRLIRQAKNTCFAGGKDDNYSIRNARHLYNVRYMEVAEAYDSRAVKGNGKGKGDTSNGITFMVNEDINWADFQHQVSESGGKVVGYLYDSSCDSTQSNESVSKRLAGNEEAKFRVARMYCEFPSIPALREGDTLDGNGKTITGISITEAANEVYSTYYNAEGNETSLKPTGFININYGTVKNLTMDNIKVSGDRFVGGLIGVNVGQIKDIELLNTDGKSLIIGNANVGGIVGAQLLTNKESRKATLSVYDDQTNSNRDIKCMALEELVNNVPVEGVSAVGGIIGAARNDYSFIIDAKKKQVRAELDGLDNSEDNYLKSNGNNKRDIQSIVISDCENYGAIQGCYSAKVNAYNKAYLSPSYIQSLDSTDHNTISGDEDKDTIRYIGGIAGYTYNADAINTYHVVLRECTSSPQYEEALINKLLEDANAEESGLNGTYVGGIAGYNYYGQIDSCSTEPRRGSNGYVFGHRYVGGIVGFNIGPASGIVGGTDKQGTNHNHVIAYEYAGGITGCSADVDKEDSKGNNITAADAKDPEVLVGILIPDENKNLQIKVGSWTNKGVVIATSRYAGGITGYNTGWIYGCNCQIASNQATAMFDVLKTGDYSGGIAGYNNGNIGNSQRDAKGKLISKGTELALVCYVRGNNYVGGVVGYNDVDAIVEDYNVKSGVVYAEEGGCFAGGYAGFNASIDLVMDTERLEPRVIKCSPSEIRGQYFVGGIIGANMINTNLWKSGPQGDKIVAVFNTDNFLGSLEGKEFVGGFVGYNMLLDSREAEIIEAVQGDLVQAFRESDKNPGNLDKYDIKVEATKENDEDQAKLREKIIIVENIKDIVKNISGEEYGESSTVMYLSGKGDENTSNRLSTIKAQVAVGGVLGYVDKDTELYIRNIDNATPIVATGSVAHPEEQYALGKDGVTKIYRDTNYIGEKLIYRYSYAGGIIGKVGKKTTVENCSNIGLGTVKTIGTYTGGLAEINEGTIKLCSVKTLGNSNMDYVGGLCGLNKDKAIITQCSIKNQTVNGRNVVGGLAAENFGKLDEAELVNAKISAAGKKLKRNDEEETDGVSGIYTAYNGKTGVINLKNDIAGVSVKSAGQYVGIVAGCNSGYIKNANGENADRSKNIKIRGSLEGRRIIGALCGYNDDQDETHAVFNFTNYAPVKSTTGHAGGLIGVNSSKNTIKYCENRVLVNATDGGNCGGITSVNDSNITECYNYAEVISPNGMNGGITALNDKNGVIRKCCVQPESDSGTLKFSSNYAVGGVAAQNSGRIENNYLKNVVITNNARITGTNMGIICGENLLTGEIYLSDTLSAIQKDDAEVIACKVRAESNNCKLGGIAGSNSGLIQGAINKADTSQILSVIDCTLEFGTASYGSMGGVAGVNTGYIDHVAVDGNIDGRNGGEINGYGGIAGISGFETKEKLEQARKEYADKNGVAAPLYPATITNCTFDGRLHAIGSSGTYALIGGIAGNNLKGSLITNCYIGARDSSALVPSEDETVICAGDISKDSSVAGTDKVSGSHIGGIAGDNSGKITDCDNNKYSRDNVKIISFAGDTGGIVGCNDKGGIVTGYKDSTTNKIYKVTSGRNWTIDMRCAENNHGPGGIIGRNESGRDIEYVDNYADVTIKYQANDKCGGLIGSNQQMEVGQITFSNCNNYGKITGYGCTGGFIGQEWFHGCIFNNCTNYGEVGVCDGSVGSQRYVAGFIATCKVCSTDIVFNSCQNHGYIHCNTAGDKDALYIAGFIGYIIDEVGDIKGYMTDCVNTGIIEFTDDPADSKTYNAAAFISKPDKMIWYLTLCRNYNTNAPSTVKNGGFTSYNTGNKFVLKDCLDVSNLKSSNTMPSWGYAPFANTIDGSSVNNYYVDASGSKTLDSNNNEAYFSAHKGSNGDNYMIYRFNNNASSKYDSFKYSAYKNYEMLFREPSHNNRFKADKSNPLNIKLTPGDSFSGMNSFVMYMWNGQSDTTNITTVAEQYFNITFIDKDGNKYTAGLGDVSTSLDKKTYTDSSSQNWISVKAGPVVNKENGIFDNRVEIKVPSACDPKDVRNIIITNGNALYLYGMGWIPSDGTNGCDSALLTGLSKKNGIRVTDLTILNSEGNAATQDVKFDAASYDGFQFKMDFLDWDMYKDKYVGDRVRLDAKGTTQTIDGYKHGNNVVFKFTLTNKGTDGINTLHFKVANDSVYNSATSAKKYSYEYGYKLVDVTGKVYEVPVSCANYIDNVGSTAASIDIDVAGIVTGGNLNSSQLANIEIVVRNAGTTGYHSNDNNNYVFFKGLTYEGTDTPGKEQVFAIGDEDVSAQYNATSIVSEMVGARSIHKLVPDYLNNGGTSAAPYMYVEFDREIGFNMKSNDPLSTNYFKDIQKLNTVDYTPTSDYADANNREGVVYDDDYNGTLDSGVTNSRISVFEDIDPKFVQMIRSMYASKVKLQKPLNPVATVSSGYVDFTWDRVTKDINGDKATPYGYEIEYEVIDKDGNRLASQTIFQLEQATQARQRINKFISIEDEWYRKESTLYIKVKAVNGARYIYGTEEYDSDPSDVCEIKSDKVVLIEPVAHFEMTAGNKMCAVVDNYQDYLDAMVTVKNTSGDDIKVPMASICEVEVRYEDVYTQLPTGEIVKPVVFTVDLSKGRVSEETKVIRSSDGKSAYGNKQMTAVAKPQALYTDYAFESSAYVARGNGYGNDMLEKNDQYTTAYFDGFYGENAEDMSYQIRFVGGDDSHIVTDIGAYSEETGTYVYYGNYGDNNLHIGGSDGGASINMTSSISGLPKEWFSSEFNSEIEAREYLIYSQRKIIHYGHEVKTGISLEGTREENQAILSAITDEYYLSEDGIEHDFSIWDNGLKPGYVLYRNGSGTYDIWYYAPLELSIEEAGKYNASNNTDMRKYRRYCVDATVYVPMKDANIAYSSLPAQNYLNGTDYQEGYWMRRQTDSGYKYKDKKYTANNQMQDIMPAPIADGAINIIPNADGTKTYSISWDTFYRDNHSWDTTAGKYADDSTKAISLLGFYENASTASVPTWNTFREKSAIYDSFVTNLKESKPNSDNRKWVNTMMNAYYFTYSAARYKAYMIGTTLDGSEVILGEQNVDSPQSIGTVQGTSYSIKSNDSVVYNIDDPTYDMWNYSCSFTDTEKNWDQYKTIKIRIMRLGETESINLNHSHIKVRPDSTAKTPPFGYTLEYYRGNDGAGGLSAFELPRYSEYVVKQKLNLDKLTNPSVENVITNLEYPEYKVSWGIITDEAKLDNLGGYLVTVKDTDPSDPVASSYYLIENLKDPSYQITKDNISFMVDDLNVDRIKPIAGAVDGNICSISLNLSDYSGKTLVVTVRAIARDDTDAAPTEYTHGEESDSCPEFTIYSSLVTPDATNIVESADYSSGLELIYDNSDGRYAEEFDLAKQYKIVAAIAVYDEIPAGAEADSSQMVPGDAPEGAPEIYWNTGAIETLYSKAAPMVIADATTNPIIWKNIIPMERLKDDLGLLNYSGKYLKIVLKAASPTLIDSAWTDEDIDGISVNCKWIHIPDLTLDITSQDPPDDLGSNPQPLGVPVDQSEDDSEEE